MADYAQFGSTESFSLPQIGGTHADVIRVGAMAPDQTILVKPTGMTGAITSWTLGFDILVPAGQPAGFFGLVQTDIANGSDAELFLRADGGIGISSVYEGSFDFGAWQRVVITAETEGGVTVLSKFIDGELAGVQNLNGSRWTINADTGFLLLSDNDGETMQSYVSSVFFDNTVLSADQVSALGGATANGFFDTAPNASAIQFDFADASYAPRFGEAALSAPQDDDGPAAPELAILNRVSDLMKTPGSVVQIDVSDVFSRDDVTLSIESDDPDVIASAVIENGVLTLTFGDTLGHADLKLIATDSDGNTAVDNFRARSAGPNAYTIAVLPDTQDYTDSSISNGPPQTFYNMTQWLADNKDSHNIVFVSHVGDITQNNQASDWAVAEGALRQLDGILPYSLLPGNHDQATGGSAADHSTRYLDELFSPEKQKETNATFGGAYDQDPDSAANTYHTFTAPDGTKWLVLSMEFGPRDDVIRWGKDVLAQHMDHQAIVLSHALTNWPGRHNPLDGPLYGEGAGYDYGMQRSPEGANDGETVWREIVSKFPNVAFTFSGHIFGDGAEAQTSYSQHGNRIVENLVNYQNGISNEITGGGNAALGGKGGNGAIRLVTIDPDNNRVTTETYFTELDQYLDGGRGDGELSRDGLTGEYRGHQETYEDWDLSTPVQRAVADAGDDVFVAAEAGAKQLGVTLDAGRTIDPFGVVADDAAYEWVNADGDVIATGKVVDIDLGVGRHDLLLRVTDRDGNVTTDRKMVVVTGDTTKLHDNFNDGDDAGWGVPEAEDATLSFGTPESFGLKPLDGGSPEVLKLDALTPDKVLSVSPNLGVAEGTMLPSYTVAFDVLVPDTGRTWFAFLQTDPSNGSDAEMFIQSRGNGTGGIGIGGNYTGNFVYGEWQRVVFTVQDNGNGNATLAKYIQGQHVGSQSVSTERFSIDLGRGALLFSDDNNETTEGYVSSVAITDKVFTAAEIAELGGAKAGGIFDTAPTPYTAQFVFDGGMNTDLGPAELGYGRIGVGNGNFLVKGTVHGRTGDDATLPAPEGRLYEQSNSADNVLIWKGDGEAAEWADYSFEFTLRTTDKDGIGGVFYWQDADNHYRIVAEANSNTRQLIKVANGEETVLASESGALTFNADQIVKVAVVDGTITAFLNGRLMFGGAVVDESPLSGGTVGFWSDRQHSSQFDDALVSDVTLNAHAGDDQRVLDTDGDGAATITLSASGTYGLDDIASWTWVDAKGNIRATTAEASIDLAVGVHDLTLIVTDIAGNTATDRVDIEVVGTNRQLLVETFEGENPLADWRIVDGGEFGGVGPDGKSSDWTLTDGALVQNSDLQSRQLTHGGASNSNVWNQGWSPLGDGTNVLRVGTYALYEGEGAYEWDDYSVSARIVTPDDDALGFLFHYVDDKNYYKLEVDADGQSNAGSLFQLLQMKDGVESILSVTPQRYTVGEAFDLRVDIVDQKISAFINDDAIFAYAIEDHAHQQGTFALYSWGSAGVAFDDVTVISLDDAPAGPVNPEVDYYQDGAGTPRGTDLAALVTDPTLIDGVVAVSSHEGHTLVENVGVWNAVKAAVLGHYQHAWGTEFTVANFVDARLDLSFALDQVDVTVVGAKRGILNGGAFDDQLTWIAHSNESTWSNAVSIDAGAGDDVITVRAVSSTTLDNELLADNAAPRNGTHWNAAYDGRATTVHVDGGDGDDVIQGFDMVRLIARGGAGDDIGRGGDGDQDIWVLDGNQGDYEIAQAGDTWTIRDMVGNDGVDTITGFEFLRYGNGTTVAIDTGFAIA